MTLRGKIENIYLTAPNEICLMYYSQGVITFNVYNILLNYQQIIKPLGPFD